MQICAAAGPGGFTVEPPPMEGRSAASLAPGPDGNAATTTIDRPWRFYYADPFGDDDFFEGLSLDMGDFKSAGDDTSDDDTDGGENSLQNDEEEGQKEPGSVSFELGGGRLAGYSYSDTGLDLMKDSGEGFVLMLQSQEVDFQALEKDGSMSDAFQSSNDNKLYGMENFEDYKDLFKEQKETKDYAVTGIGMSMNMGGYTMRMLQYGKPPQKRKKVFFGNGGDGPYRVGASNIIPGSDIVSVDGAELARNTDYTIHYAQGEIFFAADVREDERILVEYEIHQGGGGPGKFRGFRVETKIPGETDNSAESAGGSVASGPGGGADHGADTALSKTDAEENAEDSGAQEDSEKPFLEVGNIALSNWGMSYLTDDVISYKSEGSDVVRREQEHTLVGFEGAFEVGGGTKFNIEAAQSTGDKSREAGHFARAIFSILDSSATDGNPRGPYYLDDDKLPVIENSEEVRINGELLTRGDDYRLDPDYGSLRFLRDDMNFTGADEITIEYRYTSDADLERLEREGITDRAGVLEMENQWGGLTHSYAIERRGADFMQVGGETGSLLNKEDQGIKWDSGRGFSAAWGRTASMNLQDHSTGRTTSKESGDFSASFSNDSLKAGFKQNSSHNYDSSGSSDSTRDNTSYDLAYEFNEKYKVDYSNSNTENTDLRSTGYALTTSSDWKFGVDAEPIDRLNVGVKFNSGSETSETDTSLRESGRKGRSVSLKYRPGRKFRFTIETSRNDFYNDTMSLDPDDEAAENVERPAATEAEPEIEQETELDEAATDTETVDSNTTGNRQLNWSARYMLSKSTYFYLKQKNTRDTQLSGDSAKDRIFFQAQHRFGESSSLRYRRSQMDSARPNRALETSMDSWQLKSETGWFGGTELALKMDTQGSDIRTETASASTTTSMRSDRFTLSAEAMPFWEERAASFEVSTKRSDKHINGEPRADLDRSFEAMMEIPFFGDSHFTLRREQGWITGSRSTRRRSTELTLNGSLSGGATTQFSWRREVFSDASDPAACRLDESMNLVLKSNYEW